MPSDWNPYVLGADLRAKTTRDRNGEIKHVSADVNYAERRYYTQSEYDELPKHRRTRLDQVFDDEDAEEKYEYVERSNGASATVTYKRDSDGRLRPEKFSNISTGDDEDVGLSVLRLLFAGNMAVSSLPDVDADELVPPRIAAEDHIDRGLDVEIVE